MPKLDDQISILQQKLQQLQLRQQRVDARKRAIRSFRERKADTRRKILMGALILEKLRRGELDRAQIHAWLEQTLTRAVDRALFDLPARDSAADGAAESDTVAPGEPELPPRLENDDGHSVR